MNFEFENDSLPSRERVRVRGNNLVPSPSSSPVEGEKMNAVNVANLPETNGKAGLPENY
jgi:hypothetical protein